MRSLVHVPQPVAAFYDDVMKRKHDDHHASHNDIANQALHLASSSVFLLCYVLVFRSVTLAMWLGVPALLLRQFGHAVLEPACHDAEKLLLGYNTRNKTAILMAFLLLPFVNLWWAGDWTVAGFIASAPITARHWLSFTMLVVFGRTAYLTLRHNLTTALVWLVKLVTDPLTDLLEYRPWRAERSAA